MAVEAIVPWKSMSLPIQPPFGRMFYNDQRGLIESYGGVSDRLMAGVTCPALLRCELAHVRPGRHLYTPPNGLSWTIPLPLHI